MALHCSPLWSLGYKTEIGKSVSVLYFREFRVQFNIAMSCLVYAVYLLYFATPVLLFFCVKSWSNWKSNDQCDEILAEIFEVKYN